MNTGDATRLPEGITLRRGRRGGYELRLTAQDLDELVWRLHDLVTMIQDGRFERYADALGRKASEDSA